jgi:hypothetical protein
MLTFGWNISYHIVDIVLPAEETASSVPDTTRMRGECLKVCFLGRLMAVANFEDDARFGEDQ